MAVPIPKPATLWDIIGVVFLLNGAFSGIWYYVVKWWSGSLRSEIDRRAVDLKTDIREMVIGKTAAIEKNIDLRQGHVDHRLNRHRKDIDEVRDDCKECRKTGGIK